MKKEEYLDKGETNTEASPESIKHIIDNSERA